MPILSSCPECYRYLCKIKATASAMDRANWEMLLTQHQLNDHRNPAAALFPGKIIRTEPPRRKP